MENIWVYYKEYSDDHSDYIDRYLRELEDLGVEYSLMIRTLGTEDKRFLRFTIGVQPLELLKNREIWEAWSRNTSSPRFLGNTSLGFLSSPKKDQWGKLSMRISTGALLNGTPKWIGFKQSQGKIKVSKYGLTELEVSNLVGELGGLE